MKEYKQDDDRESEAFKESESEIFPIEPRYHPVHKLPRKIYNFLASSRLAMALLVVILACCLAGVTVLRGEQAWNVIFNSLWFNGLLVLLVVNVACCFFGRIWGRRVTVVSFGMILFHLSFVFVFLAIVYNSLFFFRGNIRLTEGESLSSADPTSYDKIEKGRFFSFSRIKGETTLVKMHTGYRVSGEDKRAAYEVSVGENNDRKQGVIYITHKLTHHGFDYFNDKEGYSLLVTMSDRQGNELYGAYLPLQSIRQKDETYLYSTGYKQGGVVKQGGIPFPAPPETSRYALTVEYSPSRLEDRGGESLLRIYELDQSGAPRLDKVISEGKVKIGTPVVTADRVITVKEVRYWVGMLVRYEPGKPVVLASLWVGLIGMIITTIGRMVKTRR